jgi:hypothetical protein
MIQLSILGRYTGKSNWGEARLRAQRRRTARRRLGIKLLSITVTVALALVIINLVLPWAARSIADSYIHAIEQSR